MKSAKWAIFLVILLAIPLHGGTITLTAVFANKGGFPGRIDEEGTYQLLAGSNLLVLRPRQVSPRGIGRRGSPALQLGVALQNTTYNPAMVMNAPTNWDASLLVAPGLYDCFGAMRFTNNQGQVQVVYSNQMQLTVQ